MADRIDLHVHSSASDGTDAPELVVEKAREAGLAAMALTDHDTVSGVGEALRAGERLGVEVVPGIELSTDYRDNNVHLLGYFIDPASPAMRAVLDWSAEDRRERNEKIVSMLAADGFDISMEELTAAYPVSVLGRPHIAEWLMRKGYVSSVTEGFDRYLEVGRKYFIPRRRIPLARAGSMLRAAGGVPSLAHPLQYGYPLDEVEAMIRAARDGGAAAMECYYSGYTAEQEAWLLQKARAYGLGVTGGSDYHGSRKPRIALGRGTGNLDIPRSVLEELRDLKSK